MVDDAISFASDVPHAYVNEGADPARVLPDRVRARGGSGRDLRGEP
jgi:hypothetical protein